MNASFYNSVSGMLSSGTGLDVEADNIANINAYGFRSSVAEFANIYKDVRQSAIIGPEDASSYGSHVQAISTNQEIGSFINTDKNFDVALESEGWFGVVDQAGRVNYTRNGAFLTDANSHFVNGNGYFVLGEMGDNINNGVLSPKMDSVELTSVNSQSKIELPSALEYPPEATTFVSINGNLGFNISSNVSGNVESRTIRSKLIGSDGETNTLHVKFERDISTQSAEGSIWKVSVMVTDTEYPNIPGTANYNPSKPDSIVYDEKIGAVEFNSSGVLTKNEIPSASNNGDSVKIDIGGEGFSGLVSTNVIDKNAFIESSKDGLPKGYLAGYDINSYGGIVASFSNGRTSAVAQIAIYHFQNDQGLLRSDGTMFQESANSGKPIFYTDGEGNTITGTKIQNRKLENSNVKLPEAVTNLIVMQKSFAANSKGITTSDDLLKTAIQMKR